MDVPSCPLAGHEYETAANCRACAAERAADLEADTGPQRPVPPPAEIVEVAVRHRERSGPVRAGRDFGQAGELLPTDGLGVSTCSRPGPRCGVFVDTPDGRAAHRMVFGHDPV